MTWRWVNYKTDIIQKKSLIGDFRRGLHEIRAFWALVAQSARVLGRLG